MAFCVNCGKQLPENASFCPHCGADLRAWIQPAVQQQEQVRPWEVPTAQSQPQQVQPPVQQAQDVQSGYNYPQPVYPVQQGYYYSQPVYTPKPAPAPGKALATVGKILGIIGFAESILGLVITLLFMVAMMSVTDIYDYSDSLADFVVLAVETLVLSILGVVLSSKATAKGNPNAGAGKRFGWLGIVFSAVAIVNIILCIIVFAFSGGSSFV